MGPIVYLLLGMLDGQLQTLEDFRAGLLTDFRVVASLPVFLGLTTVRGTPSGAAWYRRCLIFVTTPFLVLASWNVLRGTSTWPFSSHHVFGFMSLVVVVVAAVSPVKEFAGERSERIVRNLGLTIGMSSLAASMSRSSVVAGLAVLLMSLVLSVRRGYRVRISVSTFRILLVAMTSFVLVMVLFPKAAERLNDGARSIANVATTSDRFTQSRETQGTVNAEIRIDAWTTALDLIRQRPLFGYGPGTADDLLAGSTSVIHSDFGAHNILIDLLLSFGIVGGVLIVFFQGMVVAWVGRSSSIGRTGILLFVAALGFGLSSNSLLSPGVLIPMLLGMQTSFRAPVRHPRAATKVGVSSGSVLASRR